MNLKKSIYAALLSAAVMGGLAPGTADAGPLSSLHIQPLQMRLNVTDDDSTAFETITQTQSYFNSGEWRVVNVGDKTTWTYGACSGLQDDGEVWVQVTTTAKVLSTSTYEVHTHLDLYEDTSSACGLETRNYPLSSLDRDGWSDLTTTETVSQGVERTLHVNNILEGPTLDHGRLKIFYQAYQ